MRERDEESIQIIIYMSKAVSVLSTICCIALTKINNGLSMLKSIVVNTNAKNMVTSL